MTAGAVPEREIRALGIVVVGSANQDYIIRLPAPPRPGETVLATSLVKQPGGKGANQAVAAARLGGDVNFVAAVGDDDDGAQLISGLRSEGVDTANVEIISRGRTGLALVSVYDSGENSITVVPGTNFSLTSDRVRSAIGRVVAQTGPAIMVVQAEVLPAIITAAVTAAEAADARVIFNLAPFQPVADELLAVCDPLVLNETEASGLLRYDVEGAASAEGAVAQLRRRTRSVVITLGAEGAYWADERTTGHVPAVAGVQAVDTTGAGDAFVGALAVELARGASLKDAVSVGVRAGTFAVSSTGAQSSYPTRADLGLDDGASGEAQRVPRRGEKPNVTPTGPWPARRRSAC
jgi:ribokinase